MAIGVIRGQLGDSLDVGRPPGGNFDVYERPTKPYGALGDGHGARSAGQHALDDRIDPSPEDLILAAAHPGITEKSRASGENTLIRGLHVGVGANHPSHLPVEKSSHGDLLAGRLCVKIEEHDLGALLGLEPLDLGLDCQEWVLEWGGDE